MTTLQVRAGHHGDVVGEIHVDGSLETNDSDLRNEYEAIVRTAESGTKFLPYTYPEVVDGNHTQVVVFVRAGDPEFLSAVAETLGGQWVCESDDGLPPFDPETYDSAFLPSDEI